MNAIFLNCILLFLSTISILNAQQITDNNFVNAIRQQCPVCIDNDDKLTKNADTLKILDVSSKKIKSLDGFLFVGLMGLNCGYNKLTSLPNELPNSLIELYCYNNQLTTLPILPKTLIKLGFNGNLITCLPNLPAKVKDNELPICDK